MSELVERRNFCLMQWRSASHPDETMGVCYCYLDDGHTERHLCPLCSSERMLRDDDPKRGPIRSER